VLKDEVKLTGFQSMLAVENGVTILCNKIPGMLMRAYERNHKEPMPPMKEHKVLGGGTEMSPDASDPEYVKELAEFEAQASWDFMELASDFIVVLDDNEHQELQRNAKMQRYGFANTPQDRLDMFVFDDPDEGVLAECVKAIVSEVMRLSTITAKEVNASQDGFRPEVDGDVDKPSGVSEE
jgi:hypothetical protein